LFQQNWEGFLEFCVEQIDWTRLGKGSFFPSKFLFGHLQDVQPFYRGLVLSRKSEPLMKSGVENLSKRMAEELKLRLTQPTSIPIPILANYLAAELFALLKWWLDERMSYPPERMDQIFHALVNPAFQSGRWS